MWQKCHIIFVIEMGYYYVIIATELLYYDVSIWPQLGEVKEKNIQVCSPVKFTFPPAVEIQTDWRQENICQQDHTVHMQSNPELLAT